MDGSVNRYFGYVFGATYVLVGLAGFAVTGGLGFAGRDGNDLILFSVNPLHNLVHIAVGGLLLAGALAGLRAARTVNGVVGATYLAVAVLGFALLDSGANILALDQADNVLHLVSAAAALAVAAKGDRTPAPARANR